MVETIVPEAIFIGSNKQTQVSDLHKSKKIVAFGAGKTIALWNPVEPNNQGVYATLKGHEAEVTCVRFIPDSEFMVSASEDHHVKIWKFTNHEHLTCIQTIEHYSNTIVALTALPNLISVGCADGTVTLWKQDTQNDRFSVGYEFTIHKGFFYPLCLSLSEVQKNKYLLAIGGTNVHVFIASFVLNNGEVENCKIVAELEGHEDWIKSLAFRHQETTGDYLLCSGSQDRYIRLWRIRVNDLIDDTEEDSKKLTLLSNKQYKFYIDDKLRVGINFEALIMGHDDWISSLQWHESRLQLLAATADTSLMVWEPDETSGIWICGLRLGEISSKGASTATGSSGGFWSCLWFAHEGMDFFLTNGKTGSWRTWCTKDNIICDQRLGISGATNDVTDVAWSPSGEYLLATSLDQTTRLFAPWIYDASGRERELATWHEFSRPQIHGYDMICVEPITDTRFVSGGDEKILRSFNLPKGVAGMLRKFVGSQFAQDGEMPESATVPVLGLSNKAGEDDTNEDEDENEDNNNKGSDIADPLSLESPPMEDQLQRHLLWPEVEKLYGHGYEITCLDISPDQKLIASACRSNNVQNAVIRIFSTENWLEIKPALPFHSLTITRLKFSKDGKFLLSVCRDRKWALWERNMENDTFELKYKNEKPHTRIIWDADWAPLEFGHVFVTASRDKTVKVWRHQKEPTDDYVMEASVKHDKPVTAVSVHDSMVENEILISVGLENGRIYLYSYSSGNFKLIAQLKEDITPADKVTRLRWSHSKRNGKFYLGVGSSDFSTRIYSLAYK
ncbi:elp2p [Saccharomyces arboricola H-6]|uniref:Elongator complex protein 2 n=1 Tax=Saccharomyces arboricola (strain H-6 / AS 2.3317 / CBS 10644) TaxID=1160507 RepID=J8Q1Q3_SACAR|nr:elp2p [Saccharomyces arboricola H-6]